MPQNFLGCDREQVLSMPPSLQEWLSQNHLAWFVLGAVEQMDLAAFYAAYRADGHGRAAHEPAMMVGLLIYAYARGQRSSRRIERSCIERARRLDLLRRRLHRHPPTTRRTYLTSIGTSRARSRLKRGRAAAAPLPRRAALPHQPAAPLRRRPPNHQAPRLSATATVPSGGEAAGG
jgi:hypothetical protein